MKQTFEGWTVAAKINEMGDIHTYFMGTHHSCSGLKYVTLEACPTHVHVLKNLHKTKEEAMDFWKNGMWKLCIDRKEYPSMPVKIKVDIDVSALGLDWNGM